MSLQEGHDPAANELHLTDFLDMDVLQSIQDSFADAVQVASIITWPDGVPITKPSNFCRLCDSIIRQSDIGLIHCQKSDAILGQPKDGPTVHRCFSGSLLDAGVSISIGGKHVANWLIGQVRDEEFDDEAAINYADAIGVDRDIYRNALDEVPEMSRSQFEKISHALYLIANQISLLAHQKHLLSTKDQNLEQMNRNLETKVEQRTAELKKALDELEFSQELLVQQEKIAALGNLVAGIAHEINTPLGICVTSISYLGELIDKLIQDPGNSDIKADFLTCAELLQLNINRAADLISNFKRIALDHEQPSISEFSLEECIESTFKGFSHELKKNKVQWSLDSENQHRILGDRSQWLQIFTNLISNSIVHGFRVDSGTASKHISLKVDDHMMHDDHPFLRIVYQDNGTGVSEKISHRIFEPYVTTRKNFGGSGLGLHIINTILSQRMNGTIHLDQDFRDGTRFIINVPNDPI